MALCRCDWLLLPFWITKTVLVLACCLLSIVKFAPLRWFYVTVFWTVPSEFCLGQVCVKNRQMLLDNAFYLIFMQVIEVVIEDWSRSYVGPLIAHINSTWKHGTTMTCHSPKLVVVGTQFLANLVPKSSVATWLCQLKFTAFILLPWRLVQFSFLCFSSVCIVDFITSSASFLVVVLCSSIYSVPYCCALWSRFQSQRN